MLGGSFGGFVCGMDYDLAFFAHADAFGADAGDVFQGEVDDAAFARGHGIQAERLARSFDAFGGNFGGHAQLFKTQRAVAGAVDMNFFVEGRLEAQRAERQSARWLSGLRRFVPAGFLCLFRRGRR